MQTSKKVIIVDDDSTSLFISKKTLELSKEFSTIQTLDNPLEALEYLKDIYLNDKVEELPSLILVDINMPEMNGWEFIEEFNKIESEKARATVINILSSSDSEKDIKKAGLINRISNFFTKPLTPEHAKTISGSLTFNKYTF
jgi:CheY-like chemotaxis protein